MLIPYQSIDGIAGIKPQCNCGRIGDLESLCSLTAIEKTLLPYYLQRYPSHELAKQEPHQAAKLVRGLAEQGDAMCKEIFRVQAHALGLILRRNGEYLRSRCPDRRRRCAGNGCRNFSAGSWQKSASGMPTQRAEQADIPIHVMPNGDTAGARGAALEALKLARQGGLA